MEENPPMKRMIDFSKLEKYAAKQIINVEK